DVVYGQSPPTHVSYMAGDSHVEAVDRSLLAKEADISLLQFHLEMAQQRMKVFAIRSDKEFLVGDWAFKGQPATPIPLPNCTKEGLITAILGKIAKVVFTTPVRAFAISPLGLRGTTWEVPAEIQAKYPDFNADS
ncbi:hypothetical protein Tco_1511557, partial [Tanacetum coccineum]